jgi:hypothetical protein
VFVFTSNDKGNIAEAEIAAAATRLGINVLKPLLEHGRYDLAFDLGTGFSGSSASGLVARGMSSSMRSLRIAMSSTRVT